MGGENGGALLNSNKENVSVANNKNNKENGAMNMNVAAVKRFDPYAREIVESATHVALYTFSNNAWDKTNIEGTLFVYRRAGKPGHSLIIMNRLSTDNLLEPLDPSPELQLQVPFLLYRNHRKDIYGIWFYDKDECIRIAATLAKLPLALSNNATITTTTTDNDTNTNNTNTNDTDIFSMLTKAQNDYDKTRKQQTVQAQPVHALQGPSQSVMDFFAKATTRAKDNIMPITNFAPPTLAPATPEALKLMTNPLHSVEHIENQQKQNKQLNLNFNSLSLTPNNSKTTVVSANNTSNVKTMLPNLTAQNSTEVRNKADTSVTRSESPKKPALMPPTMFTSSATKNSSRRSPSISLDLGLTPIKVPSEEPKPEPLTKNQLLQAMNYLIKNDAEFMTKLHEAYVKSFSELVS